VCSGFFEGGGVKEVLAGPVDVEDFGLADAVIVDLSELFVLIEAISFVWEATEVLTPSCRPIMVVERVTSISIEGTKASADAKSESLKIFLLTGQSPEARKAVSVLPTVAALSYASFSKAEIWVS
jgi:hypothetical protein